jgi:hypothetical protein
MLKLRHALALSIACLAVLSPAYKISVSRVAADGPSFIFETPVSPASDPDPRDETSIAVSSRDEQVIAGASKLIVGGGGPTASGNTRVAYYFSSDGGRTWGNGVIPLETPQKTWGRSSDPSVVSDLDGNFYLCALMLDNLSLDNGVYVFKSTDGGRTFGDPKPVVANINQGSSLKIADKCYITVDTSSSSNFKNAIYVVWTSTEPDRTVILTSHRRPGDANFSEPKAISHSGTMRGPSIATGPNGEFYAAWEGIGNPRVILFNASTDGGETFLPSVVAPSGDLVIHEFVGSLSPPNATIDINGVPRMNSFPVIDVDRSLGVNRGMIYVSWAETTNRRDADIFVKRITPPNGMRPTIGPAVRVNTDTEAADQFFPWLSVDSTTGDVEVVFYDRRENPGTVLTKPYLARSTDGGATFIENDTVSQAAFDTRIQSNVLQLNGSSIGIGDYIGLSATRGKAHLLWTDTRRGKQEVFCGQIGFLSSPPPFGLSGDDCKSPRLITSVPYFDGVDTTSATSSADDPVSCTGNRDTNTMWYAIISGANTTYAIDTSLSDYDTVISVYRGACGVFIPIACNDDFGNTLGNRALLTLSALEGARYMIEVSGKGSGGSLRLRVGYPAITSIVFTSSPVDGSDALEIHGAGFVSSNAAVTAQVNGEDVPLPNVSFTGQPLPDGTATVLYASKKKLRKLFKSGSVLVRVESPAGSGRVSNSFLFAR